MAGALIRLQIKGLNSFAHTEQRLLRALQCPKFNIHGMRHADPNHFMPAGVKPRSRTDCTGCGPLASSNVWRVLTA